ncbi:MAG: hypothetical protein D3910_28330, partial [Candidatus Electrothrix sp. ATG2]|nr:hypothetical protein [Candidatus Electrothrix sp. ATG2]
ASYFTGAGGLDLGFEQASNESVQFETVFSTGNVTRGGYICPDEAAGYLDCGEKQRETACGYVAEGALNLGGFHRKTPQRYITGLLSYVPPGQEICGVGAIFISSG